MPDSGDPYFYIPWVVSALWASSLGMMAWYLMNTATTITYVTLADGRRTARQLPLVFRLLLPWTPNLGFLDDDRHAKARDRVQRRVTMAGFDALLRPSEFLGLKVLMPLVVGPVLILMLWIIFQRMPDMPGKNLRELQLWIFLLVLILCFVYPNVWLNKMVKQRHKAMERALPFVLDLLTLSVEAGLDFMTGIKRIIDRRAVDPLGEELIRVFREMQVGRTRREALRDMATRTNHRDIKSLVNALVQADELGVSIGSVLRIQADQMRQRRFQRAEEMANKAPVKMLFPLTCFIFPAVFLILLGPVLLDVAKAGIF